MISNFRLLSLIAFVNLPYLSLAVSGSGTINNKALAADIADAAITPSAGNYYFQNYDNGRWLHFSHSGNAYNIYPASGSSEKSALGLKVKSGTAQVRISVDSHCGSAQWSDDDGVDIAMVLYACYVLPTVSDSTLTPAKQFYYFVPKSFKAKRDLSRSHLKRNRNRVRTLEEERGEEVDITVRDEVTGEHVEKRATKYGPYFIIPTDHILDMKTRALTGTPIDTPGGEKSTYISTWNPSATNELWYLYKA